MSPYSHRTLSPKVVLLDGFHHQVLHTRGLRLHAVTAGDPGDPAVVLLHDCFGSWMDFRRVIEPLAARGLHVVALDLRGYGYSDKPPTGHDLRHLNGDVSGVIRTLGHDDAHVVGVGSTAAIAWTMAASHPEHINGLTCIDGIHPVDMRRALLTRPWLYSNLVVNNALTRLPRPLRQMVWRRRDRFLAHHLRAVTSLGYQQSERFTEDLGLRQQAMSVESTYPAVMRTQRLATAVPPTKWMGTKVTIPVQFVGDDTRHSTTLAYFANARAQGRFQRITLPNARWRPHLEAPAELARVIADFALITQVEG